MKSIALFISLLPLSMWTLAVTPGEVRWHDEGSDISRIETVAEQARLSGETSVGAMTALVALQFIGTPYVAGTLEGNPERLTIDTSGLDCTTLVELVAAITLSASEGNTSWNGVADKLRDLRYRNGRVDGYASRLHYISDWIIRNSFEGRLEEVTGDCPGSRRQIVSLDFMTSHADRYPALADSLNLARMKEVESGLRGINTYYVPKTLLDNGTVKKFLRNGDIVFITTGIKGLDVVHAGIVMIQDGEPHLLHASSSAGKVVVDELSINRYLSRNKSASGIRIVRLK